MITPHTNHILILPDPDFLERQTKAGIIINDEYLKRNDMQVNLRSGKVEAVGSKVDEVKAGDMIWYNPFDAYDVEEAGKTYQVCPIKGVQAKLDN